MRSHEHLFQISFSRAELASAPDLIQHRAVSCKIVRKKPLKPTQEITKLFLVCYQSERLFMWQYLSSPGNCWCGSKDAAPRVGRMTFRTPLCICHLTPIELLLLPRFGFRILAMQRAPEIPKKQVSFWLLLPIRGTY